jgi:Zn-dependent protease with chaperone function
MITPYNKWTLIYVAIIKYYGLACGMLLLLIGGPALMSLITFNPFAFLFYGVFCFPPAVMLVISMLPRFKKEVRKGVPLPQQDHPELYNNVAAICAACQLESKYEIAVDLSLNASLDLTKRRGESLLIITLGLPLFAFLSVSQLQSILAHEIGHYFHHDIPFGRLTYTLLQQVERSILFLLKAKSPLFEPFLAYQNYFLKQISPFSKQQERLADAFSLTFEHPKQIIDTLTFLHAAAELYEQYLNTTLELVNESQRLPPCISEFQRIFALTKFQERYEEAVTRSLRHVSNASESHPSLAERIAAIKQVPTSLVPSPDTRGAYVLLHQDFLSLEKACLALVLSEVPAHTSWEAMLTEHLEPAWKQHIHRYQKVLCDVTLWNLDEVNTSYRYIYGIVDIDTEDEVTEHTGRAILNQLVGTLLYFICKERGWRLEYAPGFFLVFHNGEDEVTPFEVLSRLSTFQYDKKEWQRLVKSHHLEEVNLGQYAVI